MTEIQSCSASNPFEKFIRAGSEISFKLSEKIFQCKFIDGKFFGDIIGGNSKEEFFMKITKDMSIIEVAEASDEAEAELAGVSQ